MVQRHHIILGDQSIWGLVTHSIVCEDGKGCKVVTIHNLRVELAEVVLGPDETPQSLQICAPTIDLRSGAATVQCKETRNQKKNVCNEIGSDPKERGQGYDSE